jgi:hypothetical protein
MGRRPYLSFSIDRAGLEPSMLEKFFLKCYRFSLDFDDATGSLLLLQHQRLINILTHGGQCLPMLALPMLALFIRA